MNGSRMKKALQNASFLALAAVAAIGFGMYIYPVNPVLVWSLLFLLWACYRLRLRALALFGGRDSAPSRRAADLGTHDAARRET